MPTRSCPLLAPLLLLALATLAPAATPDLIAAVRQADHQRVRTILAEDPAQVTATDDQGYTALHWAGILDRPRLAAQLLAAGAFVDAVGGDGGSPLHWLCHHDHPDLARRMILAGADVNLANRWGRTPLHVAVRRGNSETVLVLLLGGADPGAATREGWTPLHTARMAGRPALAQLLERAGADPEARDGEGHTPADLAWDRPSPRPVPAAALDEYVGTYDLGHGATVAIWREGEDLGFREFAPDALEPAGRDTFWCHAEPWRLVFHRDPTGAIASLDVKYLRRTVTATPAAQPMYVGSARCKECHAGGEQGAPYYTWLAGAHAGAYWRLATDWALALGRMRPHYQDLETPLTDGRCLQCHVTGATDPAHLRAASFRVEEGVGCEACHGPGSRYVDPEIMGDREAFLAAGGRLPTAETCRDCHRRDFDFAAMWPRLGHGH